MNEPINSNSQRTDEEPSIPESEGALANDKAEKLDDLSTDVQQAEYRKAYLVELAIEKGTGLAAEKGTGR